MKKYFSLIMALWAPVCAVGLLPIPHPQQTGKQLNIGKGLGTAFGGIGAIAELNALGTEASLRKVENNLARNRMLYEKSQGTKKKISKASFERREKKLKRRQAQLLADLRKAERTAHVGLMGQELAAPRNNFVERPLGAVAQGLTWNVAPPKQLFGRFLPLRTILALLDGVLSISRHFWYQSPQHLSWLTAAQRTSRLMKMALRYGFKGVPKQVLVSYALQLIGVGMSLVGNVRHNFVQGLSSEGLPLVDGASLVDREGTILDRVRYPLWYRENVAKIRSESTLPSSIQVPTPYEFDLIDRASGDITREAQELIHSLPTIAEKRAFIASMRFEVGLLPHGRRFGPRHNADENVSNLSDEIESRHLRERPEHEVKRDIKNRIAQEPACVICRENYREGDRVVAFRCGHPLGHLNQGQLCARAIYSCPVCRAQGERIILEVTSDMVPAAEEDRSEYLGRIFVENRDRSCMVCSGKFEQGDSIRLFPCDHLTHYRGTCENVDEQCPICSRQDDGEHAMINLLAPDVMRQLY